MPQQINNPKLSWQEINSCLNRKTAKKVTAEEWMKHFIQVFKSDTVSSPRLNLSEVHQLPGVEALDDAISKNEVVRQ